MERSKWRRWYDGGGGGGVAVGRQSFCLVEQVIDEWPRTGSSPDIIGRRNNTGWRCTSFVTDHVVRERNYPRILKCFQLTTLWATLLDAHTTVDSIAIGVDVTIRAHQHVIILWCETSLCLRSKSKGIFVPRWVDCGFSQKYVQEASLHMPKNPYKVRIDTIDRIKHSSKDTTNVLQVWWISPLSIIHGIWTGWCALSIWEAVDSKS